MVKWLAVRNSAGMAPANPPVEWRLRWRRMVLFMLAHPCAPAARLLSGHDTTGQKSRRLAGAG
eukprot:4436378-Karenia_brevis.AAC.1